MLRRVERSSCGQDDLGHAELGYHRPTGYKEVQTPVIDGLVKVGVNLDRFCER